MIGYMTDKNALKRVRLIALDLDGTYLNERSAVSERNKEAVRRAEENGIHVVLSTGRPFCGILPEYVKDTPIRYAVTTNGAGVYEFDQNEKTCLFEHSMDYEKVAGICDFLLTKKAHFDVFMNGDGYTDEHVLKYIDELAMPDELKYYLHGTRKTVSDISAFLRERKNPVQKVTLNFPPAFYQTDRREVQEFLTADKTLRVVSGGYMNLEFTDEAVSKARALDFLLKHLGLSVDQCMAVGDSENDLDMIRFAGVGAAMGNASGEVKEAADIVAKDNIHDGVAELIDSIME